jgi:hypothetical protein
VPLLALPPATPSTLQLTATLVEPETLAVKLALWDVVRATIRGTTVNVPWPVGGGTAPPPEPPPQSVVANAATAHSQKTCRTNVLGNARRCHRAADSDESNKLTSSRAGRTALAARKPQPVTDSEPAC